MKEVSGKRVSFLLFIIRMIRMMLSLVTITLTAKYFGVSVEKDAWLMVSAMLFSIVMLLWGPINETFRAKFIFICDKDGESVALKSASSLVGGIIIITLCLCALLALAAEPISRFAAMDLGLSGEAWFLSLFLFLLPTLLIDEINNVFSSILNAYNIFYIPELVGIITGFVYIGLLLWLAQSIGIYSMVIGQYVSTLILSSVLVIFLIRRRLLRLKWLFNIRFTLIKPFIWYSLPFFLPYAVGQINSFSERWLAGLLGVGNISILDYGRRFSSILQSVISGILTTVFIPIMAKRYVSGDSKVFITEVKDHLSVVYGIMLFAIPVLFGAAFPLCEVLYHKGTVSMEDIKSITLICRLYAVAFMCVMVYVVSGNILLASNQGKVYASCGIIAQIGVIATNFGLVGLFGLIIFPVSLGLSHLLAGVVMWSKGSACTKDVISLLIKYNTIIMVVSAVVFVLSEWLTSYSPILNLAVCCSATFLVEIGLLSFAGNGFRVLLQKTLWRN